MLFYRSHWRFAFERDPEREARCLWFAQTPDEGVPSTEADATTPEAPQNPVTSTNAEEGIRGATRASVESALNTGNTSDAAPEHLTVTQIAEAMTTMRKQIQSVRAMWLDKNVIKGMKTLSPEDRKIIEDSTHALDLQFDTILELEENAVRLNAWKGGNMQPQEFQQLIAKLTRDYPQGQDIQNIVRTALSDTSIQGAVSAWNSERGDQRVINQLGNSTINKSQKIEIAHNVWTAGDCDMLLLDMEAYVTKWHEYIAHIEKKMGELHAAVNDKKDEEKKEAADGEKFSITKMIHDFGAWRTRGIMGMGFYSINEYVSAFTKVWTAFTEARKEFEDQNANKLASGMGIALEKMQLPYGEDINRRLTSTLESDFNKKKNEFKEELGDDDFGTLVEKFSHVKFDSPKAVAVLEVAAGHGWLYELSDLTDEAWPVKILGTDFQDVAPAHWDLTQQKNYVGTLTRQNTAGGKEERQKGHDRIKEQQETEVYVKKFRSYLQSHNYWAAIGVGEALIDRGKMPEASEYLTVTLIAHLRNNPDARKYLTRSVLEQFGMMKWNEATTFSQNTIVMNMDAMNKFKKDTGIMEGPLLETLKKLEQEVRNAAGNTMDEEAVQRAVAKILSGQTVTVGNRPISIYKKEYSMYWDEAKNNVFGTYKGDGFAKKVATDYYTDASILQLPLSAFKAIYTTGSTGQFGNEEFAVNLAGFAIKRLQELQSSNPASASVFREMMAAKFKEGFRTAFTRSAPEHLHSYNWKQLNVEGGPMIATLINLGFLKKDDIFKFANGKSQADEFKAAIDSQLTDTAGLFRTTSTAPAISGPPVGR